ncbi:MAG: hypothetical protein GY703_00410 [Gammaproteobacteria bacterium]|nr:hypothetical protein [Gammaproteobacteria bacterium]
MLQGCGYIASFAPVLVDWRASVLSGTSPFVVLRNVNYGGNPIERSVVLQSVRVPLDGIAFAEFILVPFGLRGSRSALQHAQLRFVFDPDNQPQLLNLAGAETGTDTSLPDLILSWESWRAKGSSFSFREGLDIACYSLTQRVFAGPQLFLEDTLRGREWFSYRLRLPGGRAGLRELFAVGLGLGDGAARSTISGLLQQAEDGWLNHAPDSNTDQNHLRQEWSKLQQKLKDAAAPEDKLVRMPDEEDGYQPLVRSCATLARYTVLTTASRLLNKVLDDEIVRKALPKFDLPSPEHWTKEMAHADLNGVFMRAPMAVRYLLRHPELVPKNIPGELTEAGLLEGKNGNPQLVR